MEAPETNSPPRRVLNFADPGLQSLVVYGQDVRVEVRNTRCRGQTLSIDLPAKLLEVICQHLRVGYRDGACHNAENFIAWVGVQCVELG